MKVAEMGWHPTPPKVATSHAAIITQPAADPTGRQCWSSGPTWRASVNARNPWRTKNDGASRDFAPELSIVRSWLAAIEKSGGRRAEDFEDRVRRLVR